MSRAIIKDGKVVIVGDDGKPVQAGKPAAPATRKQATQQGSTRRNRGLVSKLVGLVDEDAGNYVADLGTRVENAMTMGLAPRAGALGSAVGNWMSGKGYNYSEELSRENKEIAAARDNTRGFGDVAEVAGSFLLPGGAIAKGTKNAYRAARAAGVTRKQARIMATVKPAAKAGGVSGAIAGAAGTEDLTDAPRAITNTLTGAGTGAVAGAVVAPAMALVGKAGVGISRSLGGAKGRRAARRAARAEGEAEALDLLASKGVTPESAAARMDEMRAAGADPILADLTDAAGMRVKTLADSPTVPNTESARGRIADRATGRGARLRGALSDATGISSTLDARAQQEAVRSARLATGSDQYRVGGALDEPIVVDDELQRILRGADATTTIPGGGEVSYMPDDTIRRATANAIKVINANPDMPGAVRMQGDEVVPTMRVMDQMLRSMREEVNSLYKSGQTGLATGVKAQMNRLRDKLTDANPEYADILKYQSQELSREQAYDTVNALKSKMLTNPREVSQALAKETDPEVRGAMREGFLSHILDQSADNPGQVERLYRAMTNTKSEPQADGMWKAILGDEGYAKFYDYLKKEMRSVRTDKKVGPQSITAAAMADREAANNSGLAADLAGAVGQGAIGNAPGALGRTVAAARRGVDMIGGGVKSAEDARTLDTLTRRMRGEGVTRIAQRAAKRNARGATKRKAEGALYGVTAGQVPASLMRATPYTEDKE